MSSSFERSAWKQATLKAPGAVVNGKRSGEMTVVATINVIPLSPASSEIVQRMEIQTPTRLLETYFEAEEGLTIQEGYILTVDAINYPVKALSPWPYGGVKSTLTTYELVVEDLRNR